MIFLKWAELLVNRALDYDFAEHPQLTVLEGKVIRVTIKMPEIPECTRQVTELIGFPDSAPDYSFCALWLRERLVLTTDCIQEATIDLKGNPKELFRWLQGGSDLSGIKVSGDLAVLAEMQSLLQSLSIDWEAALADQLGDAPTSALKVIGDTLINGLDALRPGNRT